jgi:hypothetical protein
MLQGIPLQPASGEQAGGKRSIWFCIKGRCHSSWLAFARERSWLLHKHYSLEDEFLKSRSTGRSPRLENRDQPAGVHDTEGDAFDVVNRDTEEEPSVIRGSCVSSTTGHEEEPVHEDFNFHGANRLNERPTEIHVGDPRSPTAREVWVVSSPLSCSWREINVKYRLRHNTKASVDQSKQGVRSLGFRPALAKVFFSTATRDRLFSFKNTAPREVKP